MRRQQRPARHDRLWREAAPHWRPTAFQAWNARYPEAARAANADARLDITGRATTRFDLRAKAFIKRELYASPADDKVLKPRLIQARTAAVLVTMGPAMLAAGKTAKEALDGAEHDGFSCLFASGRSAEALGAWYDEHSRGDWRVYEFDGKAWDTSICPPALDAWAADCASLGIPRRARAIMAARTAGPIEGKTRGGIRYTRVGQVSSGDADTSVGNTWTHARFWRDAQLMIGVTMAVLVNGDDSVVAVHDPPNDFAERAVAHGATLGFMFVRQVRDTPHLMEFCSSRFWATADGSSVLAPKPGRIFAKTFWSLTRYRPARQRAWLRGIALGLLQDCSHVPVLRTVLSRIVRDTAGV
jgi:hypothetical protein